MEIKVSTVWPNETLEVSVDLEVDHDMSSVETGKS